MRIKVGSTLSFEFLNPTPIIALLTVHHERAADLELPDRLVVTPSVPIIGYHDIFGNWCSRLIAPVGFVTLATEGIVRDSGHWDSIDPTARQHPIEELTPDTLQFLLGSRYCETSLLDQFAWQQFGPLPLGHARVQAVVDYVHAHLRFEYATSRPTRTAFDSWREGVGVCRDYAHLAISLLRCLNIPARYCTGYISDIGLPPPNSPQDFSAWIEVFLGDRWHIYDPRNNDPRMGRILIARGRDAEDVPLTLTFGPNTLKSFAVIVEELP